uniref:YqaJ viral recombinase domain-containing protein n=1 Tax=Cacopsylla melanoneura TaxID=428564 RepID=A0A8D8T824_9HEMI
MAVSRYTTSDGSLVNTILGATKVKDSVAMERGRRLEKAVLAVVSKNKQLKIKNIGLVLNDKLPIFGASPDGVSEEYVLEVKCPMSEKSLPTYFSSDKTKPAEKYLAQIMMQMLMCNKKKGLFCVASPTFETENTVTVLEVNLDNMYVQALMDRAKNFWVNSVFPKLLL